MRILLVGIAALASTAWATPISFAGLSTVGSSLYNLFVHGFNNGFTFNGAASNGPTLYKTCTGWSTGGCDLGYTFQVLTWPGFNFFASNGSMQTSNYGSAFAAPGHATGQVTWTAPSIHFKNAPKGPVVVPITFSGYLKAWTPTQWAAQSAPFFNYTVQGVGLLTASVASYSPSTIRFGRASAALAGVATPTTAVPTPAPPTGPAGPPVPTPEPATWMLALGAGILAAARIAARLSRG
jgi:PEP-CTERM motif